MHLASIDAIQELYIGSLIKSDIVPNIFNGKFIKHLTDYVEYHGYNVGGH